MNERALFELEKLIEDLERVKRIKASNKAVTFVPNPAQEKFISSDAPHRCLFGANKVGKSTGGILEDISYCIGFRPYLPKGHPRWATPFKPPVLGMIFGETWEKVDEIHTPKFEEWIPKWANAKPIKVAGNVRGWKFGNGSQIKYATYEMQSKRLEGADKHFYHFDEPPPWSHWAPITRGIMVHGGKIWLTLTLLSEGWIWDEIFERYESGDPDYFAVIGDIRDNLFNPETGAGILTEEGIRRFEKSLDESQREVRLHGKPQHLQGRIFKDFQTKAPWVVEPFEIPRDWPCIRAFDPHIKKPIAALWVRVSPSGNLVVTDELFDNTIPNMDEFRGRVKSIEDARRHNVVLSLMDSAGAAPSGAFQPDYFSLFRKYGLWCVPAPKADKQMRVMDTAERFKLDPYTGTPGIQVFSTCKHLIWELKRYVHPEIRGRSHTDRWKDIPEGPHKKDDDEIDCLLYIVSRDPRYESFQEGFAEGWEPGARGGSSLFPAEEEVPVYTEDPFEGEEFGDVVQGQY